MLVERRSRGAGVGLLLPNKGSRMSTATLSKPRSAGIAVWILNLIKESLRLHDAPDASLGISLVAIPVFFTLSSVLTYVFIGLRKGRKKDVES